MNHDERFEQLVDQHLDAVWGYSAARVGRSEAEHLVAEVFDSGRRMIERGAGDDLSRSWLIACARNLVHAHWRQAVESVDPLVDGDDPVDAMHTPDTRIGHEWESTLVLDALDRLTDSERAVLALRYLEGRPVAEVAHLIDRPHTTTRALLERARRAFQALAIPSAPTAVPAG